jgi:hypothetical protein
VGKEGVSLVTTDEKRQQRANLVIELEDAHSDFVHDREAALSQAESLNELASWLIRSAQTEPSGADFQTMNLSDMEFRAKGKYREAANFDRLVGLVDSLKVHRKKLYNLEMRKHQLSVSATTVRIP